MAVESAADMEVLEVKQFKVLNNLKHKTYLIFYVITNQDTEEDTEDVALADMVMADADITVRNRQAKSTVRSSHHCCTM